MIIYKATNIYNGKVYIGQTVHVLNKRIKQHLQCYRKDIFHKAIRNYGKDAFEWDILDMTDDYDMLQYLEEYWIAKYDSINRNSGYNLMTGGFQSRHSDYVKKKISEANKGKKRSDETRNKISNGLMGNKNGKGNIGKKISDICKIKMKIGQILSRGHWKVITNQLKGK